jgi:PE family
MSHVIATPQALADAAGNLAKIGSTIKAANSNAGPGLAGVAAPGADPVSAYLMALFSVHAQTYQVAGSQAATLHDQFVQVLQDSAGAYAKTEAANALPMQQALGSIGEAGQATAGHLIGDGPNGAGGAGHHDGVSGPPPAAGGAGAPGNANPVGGGPGADGHAAAFDGPQSSNVGGGSVGGSGGGGGGGTIGGGGGPVVIADPGGVGGGAYLGPGALGAGIPPVWGPSVPAAPAGTLAPGLAAPPQAPVDMTGGYQAMAGWAGLGGGGIGDPAGFGGLGGSVAPAAVSPAPVAPAAQSAAQTAAKTQPLHPEHPDHPTDILRDIPAVLIPLPRLRGLREKLRGLRSGLRDKDEWRDKLREDASSRPWGRDELLSALGLRPPGHQ